MITHIVLGDNRLLTSSYTSVLSVDNIRYTSSMSICLTSCSINKTSHSKYYTGNEIYSEESLNYTCTHAGENLPQSLGQTLGPPL